MAQVPLPSPFLLQVGFLKILHKYEITFTLPPVHRLSKDIREAPVPSLHLKLLSVVPVPEGGCLFGVLETGPPSAGPGCEWEKVGHSHSGTWHLCGPAVWQLGYSTSQPPSLDKSP